MKISEFVEVLQNIQHTVGDIEVVESVPFGFIGTVVVAASPKAEPLAKHDGRVFHMRIVSRPEDEPTSTYVVVI